jgi:hypothetical protein
VLVARAGNGCPVERLAQLGHRTCTGDWACHPDGAEVPVVRGARCTDATRSVGRLRSGPNSSAAGYRVYGTCTKA